MKHFIMAAILLVAAKAADASESLFNPETYPQIPFQIQLTVDQ